MRRIEVPDYIQGLVFDCDGTLVDSMPLHMQAWEHVITSKGGPWDFEFFNSKKGMPKQKLSPCTMRNLRARMILRKSCIPSMNISGRTLPNSGRSLTSWMLSCGIATFCLWPWYRRRAEIVELELRALHIRDSFEVVLTRTMQSSPSLRRIFFWKPQKGSGLLRNYARRSRMAISD
jgi:hypothetical protein